MPKWRTLQVFVEWEGYRGAGEWTRTTDLLITNKLLRRAGGRVLLIYDAYIRGGYGMCTGHNSGLFRPMWTLHGAGVMSDRPQGATRESDLLSVLERLTFVDLADWTRSATR